MSGRIFLNYRREDTAAEAGRLFTLMCQTFGKDTVFMDTSSISPGTIWPKRIQDALRAAEVVIVLVGPDWFRAGSDEWGKRRIDDDADYVRLELLSALADEKLVIPTLVRGALSPPPEALPRDLQDLCNRQSIGIRTEYWDHDVKLLLRQVEEKLGTLGNELNSVGPYATPPKEGTTVDEITDAKLELVLASVLTKWKKVSTPLPEKPDQLRIELFREYKFKSFQQAIGFMQQVAPGCDIAIHHPRWENIWKTVRVFLTTWDIGHRISDRDIQLAKYFDRAYTEYAGAATN